MGEKRGGAANPRASICDPICDESISTDDELEFVDDVERQFEGREGGTTPTAIWRPNLR